MDPKKQKAPADRHRAAVLAVLGLVAAIAVMAAVFFVSGYLPLLLGLLILALPTAANLMLFLPRTQASACEPEQRGEALPDRRARRRARRTALLALYGRHRSSVVCLCAALAILLLSLLFWWTVGRGESYLGFGYYLPVVMLALFVLFIILDKWCQHAAADCDEADAAQLHGLRSAAAVGKCVALLTGAFSLIDLLGLFSIGRVAALLLSLLFAYVSAFLLISLSVRLIRREIDCAPDLTVPMPGVGGSDLGIISYLEKNTGITMRSLWSIRLIKTVIPYAAIGALLLIWGVSGVVKIDSHQQGALYRLGRLEPDTLEPGIHMTLPWPFDRVEVYDTKTVQQMTIGYLSDEDQDNLWTKAHGEEEYRLLLGGGEELVSINLRLQYRISDLPSYLKTSADPELIMQGIAYETVTARTINTDLFSLLATDRSAFADSFCAEVNARVQERGLGLEVVSVVLESIHPPVSIASVYQDLVSAAIDAEQIVLAAEGEAAVRLIAAESEKLVTVSKAYAEQHRMLAAANAEVAGFRASVAADEAYRDQYRYQKYLEAIISAYGDAKVVLVGDGIKSENIFIGSISGAK